MNNDEIIQVALTAGELLLRSGAETYRVEETIVRIGAGYGLLCEAFVLPTGIFVSVRGAGGISTALRRIHSRTVNLSCIAQINALSREIETQHLTLKASMARLDAIRKEKTNPLWLISACFALTAGIYAVLFGGTLTDGLFALVVGVLLSLLRIVFPKTNGYPFLEIFASGLMAGFFSMLLADMTSGNNSYIILTGALINLLPGVALVNGIRDLLKGDNVSGMTRIGEALLSVFILACGAAIGSLVLFKGGLL